MHTRFHGGGRREGRGDLNSGGRDGATSTRSGPTPWDYSMAAPSADPPHAYAAAAELLIL